MRSRYWIASARVHIVCVDAFRSFRGCCCTFYIEPIFVLIFLHFIWIHKHSNRKKNGLFMVTRQTTNAHLHSAVTRCWVFSLKFSDFNSICYRLILFWPFDFECVLNDMRSLNAFAFYMVIVISQNNNHIFFPCQSFSIYHLCFYVLHLDEWNYAIFRRLNYRNRYGYNINWRRQHHFTQLFIVQQQQLWYWAVQFENIIPIYSESRLFICSAC